MAKQTRRAARTARRQQLAAFKLLMLGLGLLVAPFWLGQSVWASGLTSLRPLGGVMLLAAGLVFWMSRRSTSTPPSQASDSEPDVKVVQPAPAEVRSRAAQSQSRERPQAWSAAVFDAIEWRRFEAVVEVLFQQAGFETKSQSHGADGGVDVWLYSRNLPGKPVSVVQCKHWLGKRVGVDKVRELRGVMAAHEVRRGQFATTSTFTPDAVAFAADNGIHLLDVERLLALIGTRTPEQQRALLEVALDGEYWRPTCVNCGDKLVERLPKSGGAPFWGCPAFPKCRTSMPMRA